MKIARSYVCSMVLAGLAAPTLATAQSKVDVSTSAQLEAAFETVFDGGTIDLAAGTYTRPGTSATNTTGAFNINNKFKSFTVRAAAGAAGSVILSGGGVGDILRFINNSVSTGKPVVFKDLIFKDGISTTNGLAAGVTVQKAQATFINCTFQNNVGSASVTGAGGLLVAENAVAFIFDSTFTSNSAKHFGGAMAVGTSSSAYVHNSTFNGNTATSLCTTSCGSAAGGAIHVANSSLRVSNSRFASNKALGGTGTTGGFVVAGAIFAFGTWNDSAPSTPQADVVITNSTFDSNEASMPSGFINGTAPTEGGAVHVEDQARMKIYSSRFTNNKAETGGAANNYRAELEIYNSTFSNNNATGTALGGAATGGTGFGGTISAISNDVSDGTTNNGATNRRSASVKVEKSLMQGVGSGTRPQSGGCLYVAGDGNRVYGINGVSANGTVASNRATATVTDSILFDCDAQQNNSVPGTGVGGAILADLGDVTVTGSLIIKSDAVAGAGGAGGNTSGGAVAVLNQSKVTITNSTLSENSSVQFGGAIFVQGSEIQISGSNLLKNTVATTFGSAMFSSPDTTRNVPVTGSLSNSVISESGGSFAIFDDDRGQNASHPTTWRNDIVYNGNQIRHGAVGTAVYGHPFAGPFNPSLNAGASTVTGLNSLVVNRVNGAPSTTKSTSANSEPAILPVVGLIVAAPPVTYSTAAPSDTTPTSSNLGYAWGGASTATVAGSAKSAAGVDATTSAGTKSVVVGSTTVSSTTVSSATTPGASLSANPTSVSSGSPTTLSWTTTGAFVAGAIDQAVGAVTQASGSASASPTGTTDFTYHALTAEGGAKSSTTVTVSGGSAPNIVSFTASSYLVNPGGASTISWNFQNASSVTFNGTGVSAQGSLTANPGGTTSFTLSASNAFGTSTKTITVNVNDGGTPSVAAPSVSAPSNGQTITVSGVTFSWGAVGNAQRYDIKLWDLTSGLTLFSGSLTGSSSTSTLISLPNGSYKFGVRGCTQDTNAPNCGSFGTADFTIALATPTAAPTITAPTASQTITTSTMTFTWTTVSGAQFYEVSLKDSNGKAVLGISVPEPSPAASTASTIVSLPGGTYTLTVKACQSACGSASSGVTFTVSIPAAPTSAPTITSGTLSGNDLTVVWSSISGADLYQVQVVQPAPAGPGGGALTVASQQVSGTTATFKIPPGGASILVAACTGNGCGPNSAPFSVTPSATAPTAPQVGFPMAGTTVAGPTSLITWSRIPTDNGNGNTTYRLYVQDLSRQAAALDVLTTSNFYGAYFRAEGSRYDAQVISNPNCTAAGGSCSAAQATGSTSGFVISGTSSTAPTMVQPAHNSAVAKGNIQLGWSPVVGATLYEYFVAVVGQSQATVRGVTPGLFVQVPLTTAAQYSAIVRACPAGATCAAGSDSGWGPWSVDAGPGVTNFTVQ